MKSATTPEEIDPHGAHRMWRAALARYADDCRLVVVGLRTDANLYTFRDALDALHDLESGGRQLAWLCECCGLDVEYTRSALVAWLAEKCDTL